MARDDDRDPDRKELLGMQFDAEEEEMIHGPSEEVPIKHTELRDDGRDPNGRFVAKDKAENESAGADETNPEEPKDPPVWARPPASWKKEYRDTWEAIDPKAREYIHNREVEMRAGVEPLVPKAKFADEITEVLQPYMPTIRGLGVEPKQAIGALLRADHALRTLPPDQKRNYILRLAADYGVNLGQSEASQAPAFPSQAGQDPRLFALQNELVNLKGNLAEFQQRQEEAIQQSTLNDINKFAQGVEFFEEAKPTMISLLQGGMAQDLQDAYDKAIRLDPDLFEQMQSRHNAASVKAQIAAKNQAAQKAKAAAVSPRSATPGSPVSTKAQDRRSMLYEQFNGLSDRL